MTCGIIRLYVGCVGDYALAYLAAAVDGSPAIPHGPIVTNSSEAVGWIAIQESKSALVAPIFMATAKPCSISSLPIPIR